MSFNFDLSFLGVPKNDITLDRIRAVTESDGARRICFATTHSGALKRCADKPGKIVLPFNDTIASFIRHELGQDINLFSSNYGGFWRAINTEEEYEKFEKFVLKYHDAVFLRDNLDLSISLSMNFESGEEHTEIGELEYRAKFQNDIDAESKLAEKCIDWIEKLPYYTDADYICSVPGKKGEQNLPQRIVSKFSGLGLTDISEYVFWRNKRRSVKDAESFDEKLEILEESDLLVDDSVDLQGKTVVLFDDLYMSGLTMQYVAMKLKEKGASRIFGLSIVKSRRNK